MKYGDKLEFFVTLASDGKRIPALEEKPELYPDLFWVWESFVELNRSREIGFSGAQPIRFSEITAFANELGITDTGNRWRFIRRIRTLDSAFLVEATKKKEKTATQSKTGKKK